MRQASPPLHQNQITGWLGSLRGGVGGGGGGGGGGGVGGGGGGGVRGVSFLCDGWFDLFPDLSFWRLSGRTRTVRSLPLTTKTHRSQKSRTGEKRESIIFTRSESDGTIASLERISIHFSLSVLASDVGIPSKVYSERDLRILVMGRGKGPSSVLKYRHHLKKGLARESLKNCRGGEKDPLHARTHKEPLYHRKNSSFLGATT